MIARFASSTPSPFRLTSAFAELIAGPSPMYASPSKPSDGCTVRMIGRPNALGEVPVALVLPGHGHDRAGAVAHQHVVGDEHRDRDCR